MGNSGALKRRSHGSTADIATVQARSPKIRDEMIRAYRERMQSEVGIKADPSFIEHWNKKMELGVDFDAHDVVENVQAYPRYDGFRERHREFFRNRTREWHKRFG
jgi:hypothetical protein